MLQYVRSEFFLKKIQHMLQYLSINVATIVSTCLTIDVAWNVVFMLRLEYPKVERQLFLTYHFFHITNSDL